MGERFVKYLMKNVMDVDIPTPLPRLTYQEAMERFGSDKPDIRYGMELINISDLVADSGFGVFTGAIAAGGSVRGITVKGGASVYSRKEIDKLTEQAKASAQKAWHLSAGSTKSLPARLQNSSVKNSWLLLCSGWAVNAATSR